MGEDFAEWGGKGERGVGGEEKGVGWVRGWRVARQGDGARVYQCLGEK